jgi:hypothetical protein
MHTKLRHMLRLLGDLGVVTELAGKASRVRGGSEETQPQDLWEATKRPLD